MALPYAFIRKIRSVLAPARSHRCCGMPTAIDAKNASELQMVMGTSQTVDYCRSSLFTKNHTH